ncbi:MAG TPA: cobaltochelatase subunit CobN [Stellaceae bacterium]|nr:cobaltochelatase subunit CobN [Stellaceae bacterium]
MHQLAVIPGSVDDGADAVDLGQTPGEVVVLSTADNELTRLALARRGFGDAYPTLRLANILRLGHPMSVDLYVDAVVSRAKLVIVRLLGGTGYWSYGMEQVALACRRHGILLAALPGCDRPDADLMELSTLPVASCERLWRLAIEGGADNARSLLGYAASLIGREMAWQEPVPVPHAGLYWPDMPSPSLSDLQTYWRPDAPVAALTFYRSSVLSGNLAPVDALVAALRARGVNPLPIFVTSLKDPASAALVRDLLTETAPGVVLNATAFAASTPETGTGEARSPSPLECCGRPVLQVVFSQASEAAWRDSARGLGPADLAMNMAVPELDGRLHAGAVSFKTEIEFDTATETGIVVYRPVPDRIDFAADLAVAWCRLGGTPVADRRVAIVLANYAGRNGRVGSAVGLDTPASLQAILTALRTVGYAVADEPADLPAQLATGIETLTLDAYRDFLASLPASVTAAVTAAWGPPEDDQAFMDGGFRLTIRRFGGIAVGVQPARDRGADLKARYHDAALPPPHEYLAFYAWLRCAFECHAVVHLGTHGTLEWLPGKAVALSDDCLPSAVLGPMPHLYPFIVNDPGEGAQAKRRAAAVLLGHLPPPMVRADSYGPLRALETLLDEYYQASGLDPRRLATLREQIFELARSSGIDRDCGIDRDGDPTPDALVKLDAYLCDLKEMQIRDGLHVYGRAPEAAEETALLAALVRVPRGRGEGAEAALPRALAADLGLEGFDPLAAATGAAWQGSRPAALAAIDKQPWRSDGDTVERLERLGLALIEGSVAAEASWTRTAAVLTALEARLRPALRACGRREMAALLDGLDGRFVSPGPSGAPTRGRVDVLPTGRNFYSLDTRSVPTPAAWLLGWRTAGLVIERYLQDHGDWPRALAVNAWGSSNLRTGGDDIAQAMAFLGVRPSWDAASSRVTGFEILPASVLDRPRIDVTLRISGFFRDAFPAQIDLFDSATRAVAALDEPDDINPLAARVREDRARLMAGGMERAAATRQAGFRIFGSAPGGYGTGLDGVLDGAAWQDRGELGQRYLDHSGFAYGAGVEGEAAQPLLERRLAGLDGVVQAQDNREQDVLDSDGYWQFQGGLAAAVERLSGTLPPVYHADTSRADHPAVRSLAEEIGRVVRGRAVNPKWLAGVMRHGYRGAMEIAETVDLLFGYAATTDAVADQHFEAVYDAYVGDEAVWSFLLGANRGAARDVAVRLGEALRRGLWRPRSNAAPGRLDACVAEAS